MAVYLQNLFCSTESVLNASVLHVEMSESLQSSLLKTEEQAFLKVASLTHMLMIFSCCVKSFCSLTNKFDLTSDQGFVFSSQD